jgi:hypothetical protein
MRSIRSVSKRIEIASSTFLGRPYIEQPLDPPPTESHSRSESLILSLDAFDCVTYIETVLALALSNTVDELAGLLREIRYEAGVIAWEKRNHYMVDWTRNNVRMGILLDLSQKAPESVEKKRDLSIVPGLPERKVVFKCVPKRRMTSSPTLHQTGDLILFVSTRKNLDVFHTGLLIRKDPGVVLRHATRQTGQVVEQDLQEFLTAHRMSGVMLFRPAKETI